MLWKWPRKCRDPEEWCQTYLGARAGAVREGFPEETVVELLLKDSERLSWRGPQEGLSRQRDQCVYRPGGMRKACVIAGGTEHHG